MPTFMVIFLTFTLKLPEKLGKIKNQVTWVLGRLTRWVCFNDPAWESLWMGGGVGWVADTNYL